MKITCAIFATILQLILMFAIMCNAREFFVDNASFSMFKSTKLASVVTKTQLSQFVQTRSTIDIFRFWCNAPGKAVTAKYLIKKYRLILWTSASTGS